MTVALSATDVRTCEACWNAPVTAIRRTGAGRDLLCQRCAEGDYPLRVDLFPPYGIYGVKVRRAGWIRHASESPKCPPN
ncbi:hypothetical protein [Streptomyces sp. bgisy029]|uniref:hypothetical protein n=1 Tax=Streptomyces sp. bgisy029 TaxID=3413771 RepID=UPI003D704787